VLELSLLHSSGQIPGLVWILSLNTQAIGSAPERGKSFAHVAEASWGKGLSTLLRIVRMTLRHPWQVAITIISTFIAATLQLFIPRFCWDAPSIRRRA
jgi:hypothetical protein